MFYLIIKCLFFVELTKTDSIHDRVDRINNMNTTWKAIYPNIPSFKHTELFDDETILSQFPDRFFDARQNWPNCPSIGQIRNQGECGSCWAFAATGVMSDRLCIHSQNKIQVQISAEDLIDCCGSNCGGCRGGDPLRAFQYWMNSGVVTGGGYNSSQGCKWYSFPECDHSSERAINGCRISPRPPTPKCVRQCLNQSINYDENLYFGISAYEVYADVASIQHEIYRNGSVAALFAIYKDFLLYKEGIYQHVDGPSASTGHFVKVIGWGEDNGVPYWLCVNSWGSMWGENGTFRILRGKKESGFELYVTAGMPKV